MFGKRGRDSAAVEPVPRPASDDFLDETQPVGGILRDLLHWQIIAMIAVMYVVVNNWIVIGHGRTHETMVSASPQDVCQFLKESGRYFSRGSRPAAGVTSTSDRPVLEHAVYGKCTQDRISLKEELLLGQAGKTYRPADVEPMDHFRDGMFYVLTGGWYLTPNYIGGKLYRFENAFELIPEGSGTRVVYRSALCHEQWTAGRMPFLRSEECWAMWDMSLFGFMAPFLHGDQERRMHNVLQHLARHVGQG